ncbi:MAG: AMIN domain-containing protein [Acidobacteriota bacterium]
MKKSLTVPTAAAVLLLICSLISAQTTQTELKGINFVKGDQDAVIQIECTKPITYESFSLLNPNRLVLDLSKIEIISAPILKEINDFGILKITSAAQSAETARLVVFFLGDILSYQIDETDTGLNLTFQKADKPAVEPEKVAAPIKTAVQPVREEIRTAKETPLTQTKAAAPSTGRVSDISISVGPGFYFFQGEEFETLYAKSATSIRGELTFTLPFNVNNLDIWVGVSHFAKTGSTSLYAEDLKLTWTTFSGALRFIRTFGRFSPFVGVGADYISYEEIYPSTFIVPSVGGSNIGAHIQGGVYVHINDALSVKGMIRYLSNTTTSNNFEINLGGVEYSFGLVLHLNL